ncbi:hypothetical protein CTEN210_06140 [Chaetoceros tenuissimus]|uniref:RBR-type E3 ubiquitin transferase n=1 Tax=Chaetoceros tenuissimus TaxID=426638 RepID=A0AAD3CS23_9STRA|nr:hypothetical protein CTEN210_06140 [Chaetoceros tenuissimus]
MPRNEKKKSISEKIDLVSDETAIYINDDEEIEISSSSSSVEEVMIIGSSKKLQNQNSSSSSVEENNHSQISHVSNTSVSSKSSQLAHRATSDQERDDMAIARALSELDNTPYEASKGRSRNSNESSKSHIRKRLLKSFTCNICLDDDVKYFLGYSLSTCNHRFCIECLANLIKSNVPRSGAMSSQITCPSIQCKQHLSLLDIQYIFKDEPESWRIYSTQISTVSIENQVSNDVNSMRRCPAERCNYVFIYDDNESVRHFDCPLCHSSFCLKCVANDGNVGPAHIEQSCVERYEQLQKEEEERVKLEQWRVENSQADARFKAMMDQERSNGMTRQCPSCKRLITKNGGCDHMMCVCGRSYNWSQSK